MHAMFSLEHFVEKGVFSCFGSTTLPPASSVRSLVPTVIRQAENYVWLQWAMFLGRKFKRDVMTEIIRLHIHVAADVRCVLFQVGVGQGRRIIFPAKTAAAIDL